MSQVIEKLQVDNGLFGRYILGGVKSVGVLNVGVKSVYIFSLYTPLVTQDFMARNEPDTHSSSV